MVALLGARSSRWQIENVRLFLKMSLDEGRLVIPVVLAGADEPAIPRFLRQFNLIAVADSSPREVARQVAARLRQ